MTTKSSEQKIFDDFPRVDCNDCSHYWDDSCEGVKKGSEKRCTAFKAVRRVSIPEEIERLRKVVKGVGWCVILTDIAIIIHLIGGWIG